MAIAFLAALFVSLWNPPGVRAAPLPVETFFKKPDYTGATLSPSGRYVAVIAPIGDHHGIGIIDLDTGAATRMSTVFGDGDVVWVGWQTDERILVRLGDWQAVAGEPPRDFGLFAINRDGSDSRRISGGVVRIFRGTNVILIEAARRSRISRDLYRYDTVTNTSQLLTLDSPGDVVRWIVDFDGIPRAAVTGSVDDDRSAWYVRESAESHWVKVEEAKLGRLQSVPMQFDPGGKILYVSARRGGSDFAAIYEYEIASGTWKGPVVHHPERDIDAQDAAFVVDYGTRKLLGLRYADDRPATVWFDPEWARIQNSVDAALPDTVNGIAHEGNRWLVVSSSDRNPGEARILDTKSMQMKPLFVYRPWVDPKTMASTTWVRYPARDGMSIPALLTLPPGPRDRPVPLVVDIHGGPNAQATGFGFDTETQFFASRGYAVLRPQFRGTQGFGWKLESAGFRHWGEAMQDDLEDAVKWAVAEKIVDPAHVCFYGWSYGGYAAAWGAIRNATTIKCAVALAAVTSLEYMFDNAQTDLSRVADRSTLLSYWIGDPKTDRARFKRVSPLDNADKVGVPIFLAYGASDIRVPLVHGADFHSALDKNHKPHEWVVYNDEGHGFNKDENRFDLYRRVERFLAEYLGASPAPAATLPPAAK
ncbi:MAG TPA: prolyl oligopeptidase family serine peptidase [Casimicrobiaceae bacterium]|nr:prolyl oligopeptidase family serine peptidase [Casimicrobiaceae bacterium]